MVIDKILLLAAAFIENDAGDVLLVQRSTAGAYPGHWQLVEGKIEQRESPDETIKREVEEEIGAKVVGLQIKSVFCSKIEHKGRVYLCLRIVFHAKISQTELETSAEHVSLGWFNKNEALELPLLAGTGDILRDHISSGWHPR